MFTPYPVVVRSRRSAHFMQEQREVAMAEACMYRGWVPVAFQSGEHSVVAADRLEAWDGDEELR